MRKIPPKLREKIAEDPFMKKCCLANVSSCYGKIEWHHNMIYAGRQLNEPFCILPLCKHHHDMADHTYIREKLDHIMLNRASDEQISLYSKAINWKARKDYLNKIYA